MHAFIYVSKKEFYIGQLRLNEPISTMDDICTACMVDGRKLFFIGETGTYHLYSEILNEIPVYDLSQLCIRVCWECRAVLKKFLDFKAQVKRSYTELLQCVHQNTPPPKQESHIKLCNIVDISVPELLKSDPDDDELPVKEIKEEMVEHTEETFVNNLCVEQVQKKKSVKKKKAPKKKQKAKKNTPKVKKKGQPSVDITDNYVPSDMSDVADDKNDDDDEYIDSHVPSNKADVDETNEGDNNESEHANGDGNTPPPKQESHIKLCNIVDISVSELVKSDPNDDELPVKEIKEEMVEHTEETFVNNLCVEQVQKKKSIKKKKAPKKKQKAKKNTPKVKKKGQPSVGITDNYVPSDMSDVADDKNDDDDDEYIDGHVPSNKADVDETNEGDNNESEHANGDGVIHRFQVVKVQTERSKEVLPDKPECVECGKIFSSRKTYRYHMNVIHKGQNSHPCPRCGKIYQWKSNLARHLRSHKARDTGELYCELCDKRFASVATYRQHLRVSRKHVAETEFDFTCSECGKKFVNKTRLRDHIDWDHLKKIKFKCQLCNKPFKCHTSLYVHLQNVHRNKDKKDNLCHVCGKSYQNAAKLKYHIIAMHTHETPYHCSECEAAFSWYSSLYRHVKEVHYKVKPNSKKKSKKTVEMPPLVPLLPQQHIPIQHLPIDRVHHEIHSEYNNSAI